MTDENLPQFKSKEEAEDARLFNEQQQRDGDSPLQLKDTEVQETIAHNPRVSEICQQYGVIIIHGIDPDFDSSGSETHPKSWQEKLDSILENKDITLSCSSVKDGDTSSHFWSPLGLVVKEGEIVDAYNQDAGSVRGNEGQRYYPSRQIDINEAIKSAIEQRGKYYNEIAVNQPEPKEVYFIANATEFKKELFQSSLGPLFKEVEKRGLSLVIRFEGKFFVPKIIEKEVDYFISDNEKTAGFNSKDFEARINPDDVYSPSFIIPRLTSSSPQQPEWRYDEQIELTSFDYVEVMHIPGHFKKRKLRVVTLGQEVK